MEILGHLFLVERALLKKNEFGKCKPSKKLIQIDPEKHDTQDEVDATLLHETIHAALFISGITNVIKTEEEEEAIVVALEHALHPLYRRRP